MAKKVKQVSAPRSIEDITMAYQELLAKAAQAQYLVYIHTEELKNINKALVNVNIEAAQRQSLNKEKAQEAAKTEEVKNVQS